jgi:Fe-S-cluster containining protein
VQVSPRLEKSDEELIQIVDAAMAEAARRSGDWLVCRPGCAECCIGPFSITPLDAARLRRGLGELDAELAGRIRERARRATGADDENCPALDPETRTCELYLWRPITCRTFGPPVRCGDQSVGVCELCFEGASDEEIAACEVEVDPDGVESKLLREAEGEETTIALALLHQAG